MRLGEFILANLQAILGEWEVFARSVWPGAAVDPAELRDHAEEILRAIARDMGSPQTAEARSQKSKGRTDEGKYARQVMHASESHAMARAGAMDLGQLCDEVCQETQRANPGCEITLDRKGNLVGTWDRIRLRQVLTNLLGNRPETKPSEMTGSENPKTDVMHRE